MASASAARSLARLSARHVSRSNPLAAATSSSSSSSSSASTSAAARLSLPTVRRTFSASTRLAEDVTTTSNEATEPVADREYTVPSAEPSMHLPPLARKNPQLYEAVRSAPRSAYVALAHRIKLVNSQTDERTKQYRVALLMRACTHPSFALLAQRAQEESAQLEDESNGAQVRGKGVIRSRTANVDEALDRQYVALTPEAHNGSMASLGNSLLGLIATEYLHLRYPNLPNRVLKAAVSAYVGTTTLADVSAELGISAPGLVRWDRKLYSDPTIARLMRKVVHTRRGPAKTREREPNSRDAFGDALRSIVALLFQEQGLASARQFVHFNLLSRIVPVHEMLKFHQPKQSLAEVLRALGKDRPNSRLIAETGRLSANAVFVVGIWSGQEKMGEGTGSSLRMAEYRAAEDALRRFYLLERPAQQISLPSVMLDGECSAASEGKEETEAFGFDDVWSVGEKVKKPTPAFQPALLGMSEVVFDQKA